MYLILKAPPDSLVEYDAELEALHIFIAMMMFMSLALSSLLSLMRRQTLEGGVLIIVVGLVVVDHHFRHNEVISREVIDSLTLKHYKTPTSTTTMTASMTTATL